MIFPEELIPMKLYKRPMKLPINFEDKRHGSLIMLLTPDTKYVDKFMNLPYILNKNKFESYYAEKNIMLYINSDKTSFKEYMSIQNTDKL